MRLLPKLTSSLLACGLLMAGAAAPPAFAAALTCSEVTLPVTAPGLIPLLSPGMPAVLRGQYCAPNGAAPKTVQLLVHGGTYNRAYWDLPYQPEKYSYQRDMAKHGYASFAVDRLGAGRSSKPLSIPMMIDAEALALHEVVGHLRAGRVGGTAFSKVIMIGHSVGSGIVSYAAAKYKGDVDGVGLTGITHLPAVPVLGVGAGLGLHPTLLDPLLGNRGSDPLWFATRPGARGPLFYSDNADPKVIAADEATKDQVSVPGMGTVAVFGIILPVTLGIDVPVFQAVGEKDILFCGPLALRDCSSARTLRPQEAPYYNAKAKLDLYVLPKAGHSLGLHYNADAYRDATRAWLQQFGA
ncbi:alpha/beta hydrolase [Allokutzneria albata]|uniref:Lysophospholipase, alpha-beta hydrolase superfamily n=1 Tax=Allokutzneria albata TaxID=211114 RepID=A0A1G9W821_ALLAB|nr:alpha/beta fold hydrolase [Allokutzneria albata]SDM80423.1 Lysophospholipase, alpha-beta hydrolase superfamily [Allokutzneria albata]